MKKKINLILELKVEEEQTKKDYRVYSKDYNVSGISRESFDAALTNLIDIIENEIWINSFELTTKIIKINKQ